MMTNLPFLNAAVKQQKSRVRPRSMMMILAVAAFVAMSGMGATKSVHRALSELRRLCETRFFYSDWNTMPETYWEELYGQIADYVPNPVDHPFEPTNIAYVLTLSDCPEAKDLPEEPSCDPGHAYYDAAAVLKYGICEKFAPNNKSSKYKSTMYAFIHPDARACVGPHGDVYDRAEVLREMGYKIYIHGTPVPKSVVADTYDAIQDDVGLDELVKLGAYKLDHHPVAVLVDFSTMMTSSIEDSIEAFIASPAEVAMMGSYTMIKPDKAMYETMKKTYAEHVADFPDNGKGSLGTSGLLSYYYQTHTSDPNGIMNKFDNSVVDICNVCGQPWECPDLEKFEPAQKKACDAEHMAWFQLRVDFEKHFWLNGLYSPMNLSYKPEVYKGFCRHEGPGGYDLMIDDKTTVKSCDPETTKSTDSAVMSFPTGRSQTQELGVLCSKTTRSNVGCISGTITLQDALPSYNIAIVVDISWSTRNRFEGDYVGDMNGNGIENEIIDAEIQAVLALLETIVSNPEMTNDNVLIGLVVFYEKAEFVGQYVPADPNNPELINPALVSYLTKMKYLGGTNFDDGLDKAIDFFNVAPTGRQNIMYFMSDGEPYNSGDGDGEERFPIRDRWGRKRNGMANHKSTLMYDSEIAALDAHNVKRYAIGVGRNTDVREGFGLDMIDNTPDPETGKKAVQVTSVKELTAALTTSSIPGTVSKFEVNVNGIVQDVSCNEVTAGPSGFAFGELMLEGFDPRSDSNVITTQVTLDFNGESSVFTTSCNVEGVL